MGSGRTGIGYDLDLLSAVTANIRIPVIASGGAKEPQHMVYALRAGASAVLAASIFHDAELHSSSKASSKEGWECRDYDCTVD